MKTIRIKKDFSKQVLSWVFIGIVLAFIFIPIISLIVFSFNSTKSLTNWTGFSLIWYQKLFSDREIMNAVITTITVALVSTLISTIIGTLAAISLSKVRKVIKDGILLVNDLPIVNPEIITAISLFIFFGAFAISSGYVTLIISHIAFSVPYVLITVYPKVRSLDRSIVDAAYDLGATPFLTLTKVLLPQLKVSIFAGAAIAFTMSFDDFVISYFAVSGTAIKNISIYLYTLRKGIEPTINALSTIIIMVIAIVVVFRLVLNKNKKKVEE